MEGVTVYLLVVVEKAEESKGVRGIPVIEEFPKVFVDDLPGLLPNREMKFIIKLEPPTAHVRRAPYRMVPTELKELKAQIEKLVENGFIQPSSSPWGALVLFVKKKG